MRIDAFILTCPLRKRALEATLASLNASDWPHAPTIVCDREYGEGYDLRAAQSLNALELLKKASERNADYLLFLEDDVTLNAHIYHNMIHWAPIKLGFLFFGSLYNPGVLGFANAGESVFWKANYFIADPRHAYGSQALVLSRSLVKECVERWHCFEGMQDIRIATIAGLFSRTMYYHLPSLVQHRTTPSTWGGQAHSTREFDPEFKVKH